MIRAYCRDPRGNAAVEFALVVGIFAIALPSVVDVGIYAYDAMQVRNSAQAGVQAMWAVCKQLPATDSTACPTASAALTQAVQRTTLSSAVTVSNVKEGYYCTDSSGALLNAVLNSSNTNADTNTNTGDFSTASGLRGKVPSPPTNCNNVTNAKTTSPGNYISVTVSYTYTPVFRRVSVASLLGTTITSAAWMRLI
jgi:Flp pilus assembly protein TadG